MTARFDTEFFDLPRPRAIAHRGASGDYPENTLRAFAAALDAGAAYIEMDIHMTRDGEVVVIHDDDLNRVAGHPGVIAAMSFAELRSVGRAGHNFSPDGIRFPFRGLGDYVPALNEVLERFPQLFFVIEIKQVEPSLVAPMLDVIKRAKMARRVLIASEHQRPLDEVRTLAPALPTNFSTNEVAQFLMSLPPGGTPFAPPGAALQIPPEHDSWKLVTPETVAAAHRLEVEVHVWTINEVTRMRELLAMGVDGIISDYPARLREIIDSR